MPPASAAPHAPAYRLDLDGLRAVAIAAVMLYHARWGTPGGFVGVDVFFVISGFLIGSQLLGEARTGRIDLSAFWRRRARRILPALALMLLGTAVVGAFVLLPGDYEGFGSSLAAQAIFASNYFFAAQVGYFGTQTIEMPLLHTWSLAVEEQFYLVFPLLLLALAKLPRRIAATAFVALCAASLLYSSHVVSHDGQASFYFTVSRAWELGLGVTIAGCPPLKLGHILRESLGIAGLGMIVAAATMFHGEMPFPGFAALLPCGGAACLILAGRSSPTVAGRLLSLRPLVFLGKISYSLYLWHWPALALVSYLHVDSPGNALKGAAYLGALAIAIVSWKYVETPFRTRGSLTARWRYLALAGATIAVLGTLGLAIQSRHGFPARVPARVAQYASGRADWVPAFLHETTLTEAQHGQFVPVGSPDRDVPVGFFVWGDSHAMVLLPAVDALGRLHRVRGYAATRQGTRPLINFIPDTNEADHLDVPAIADATVLFIRTHRIPNVVLVARWGYRHNTPEVATPQYLAALAQTFAALHAAGARVWVVEDVPLLPWGDPPRVLAKIAFNGGDATQLKAPAAPYLEQLARQVRMFSPLLAKDDRLIDPSVYLVRDDTIIVEHDGWSLFRDDHHVTVHGALFLRPMLEPIFAPSVRRE